MTKEMMVNSLEFVIDLKAFGVANKGKGKVKKAQLAVWLKSQIKRRRMNLLLLQKLAKREKL